MSASAFACNYECEFSDETITIFPYDLLKRQTEQYPLWSLSSVIPKDAPIYIGIDFGKKVSQTAITAIYHEDVKSRVMFHEVTTEDWPKQIEYISNIIRLLGPVKVLVDQGGLGGPLVDYLLINFAGIVEGVIPSSSTKEKIVLNCRNLLESGRLILPDHDDLIEQLHGFEKEVTELGNVRYTGKRTETDWLDDRAYSLFLACSQLSEGNWTFTVSAPKEDRLDPYEVWKRE